MVSSDGGGITPKHPTENYIGQAFGTFPRSLSWVREKKVIKLEDIVRRMTSMPARTLGLKDRGLIKEGFWADITVFNPHTVQDRCTLEKFEFPEGIPYVIINGQTVVDDSEHTGALPGKIIRYPL